ncbi:L-threonylcarbamoyladenylate synthase [Bythopirellula goksoeyrii]|uniref:L-threonylcarbamoyladenylate synthase n=1 Tax=Bythopirellula goksoeyrii TaxID=1400387 RepID=A0A5B9QBK2_9BACT|nr:L-threonylcarbamoyladenylate synthase [Bythopirellula goksoeyrii]QEG34892.1 Low molecular weight protein-tyrosine-phosphatase YwlE [Bythopirellula goksoeyrii]
MPPIVIDLRQAEDTRDVVHRAVQMLAEGKLVIFPTETVYGLGASARNAEAIERIYAAKGRNHDTPLALAIKSAEEAFDYVPRPGKIAERLARRCWPGPVTLVVDNHHEESLLRQLPASVQQAVAPKGSVGLRVPAHQIVLDVLGMLSGPIALTSANLSGKGDAKTAEEALSGLSDHVALVLNDGPCRYGQPSTVVRVTDKSYNCLREGVVGKSALDRLSSMIVLLVCTGNTCRSPMGEALLKKLAAEKFDCPLEELEQHGVVVASAGVAALPGCAASVEAVEFMKEKGIDLSKHESQPLTDKLVRHADLIFAMTNSHRHAILRRWPEASSRTHTLRADGGDIADPIGGPAELYRQCGDQVEAALKERLDSIDFS